MSQHHYDFSNGSAGSELSWDLMKTLHAVIGFRKETTVIIDKMDDRSLDRSTFAVVLPRVRVERAYSVRQVLVIIFPLSAVASIGTTSYFLQTHLIDRVSDSFQSGKNTFQQAKTTSSSGSGSGGSSKVLIVSPVAYMTLADLAGRFSRPRQCNPPGLTTRGIFTGPMYL